MHIYLKRIYNDESVILKASITWNVETIISYSNTYFCFYAHKYSDQRNSLFMHTQYFLIIAEN